MSTKGLVLDAGILQGIAREAPPHTPLTDWLRDQQRRGVRLVTIREVLSECINLPVATVVELQILVEPSVSPPDPQGLLKAFTAGTHSIIWHDDLAQADRAVVAHAIARHYDIVTTDLAMKRRSFKEFLTRLDRTSDARLPLWRLPQIHIAKRSLWH